MFLICMRLACAVTLVSARAFAATPPVPDEIRLELRRAVLVAQRQLSVADVAVVENDTVHRLGVLAVGLAPPPGYTERLSRQQIEAILRREPALSDKRIAWTGAGSVAIRLKGEQLSSQHLLDAAIAAAGSEFSARHPGVAFAAAGTTADLSVPSGRVMLRARSMAGARLAPRLAVWLDVMADGVIYRSVVVPLSVTLQQPAYIARRTLDRGALAALTDFEVRVQDVAGLDGLAVAADAPRGWRLRRPVSAGQVLTRAAVAGHGMVLKGDQVRLLSSTGPIAIETGATALADGEPGQLIAVRPSGGDATLIGRLSATGTVNIE